MTTARLTDRARHREAARIGKLIREAQEAKGWNNTELANRIGVNLRTIQRWRSGEILPRPAVLLELADLLGIPREELIAPGVIDRLVRDVKELRKRVSVLERSLDGCS